MQKTGTHTARRRALLALATSLPVLLAPLTTLAPTASAELRLALGATVATQCAISGIDSEDWQDGRLRVDAQCNAERYRIRLMSGETEIALQAVALLSPGGEASLRTGDAWIHQDRPGQHRIEIAVDTPTALTGPISIRLDAI